MGILPDTGTLTKQNIGWVTKVTLTPYKVGNCYWGNSNSSGLMKKTRESLFKMPCLLFRLARSFLLFISKSTAPLHCNESALKRGSCIWRDNNKPTTSQENTIQEACGSRYELE